MNPIQFGAIHVKKVAMQVYPSTRGEILQVKLDVTGKDKEQFSPFIQYDGGISIDARRDRVMISQARDPRDKFIAYTEPKQNQDFVKFYQLVRKIRFPKALMPINPNTGKSLQATTAKSILMDSLVNTTVNRLPAVKVVKPTVSGAE